MAWSHLQSCTANAASALTVSATFATANLTSGSKLIAFVATDASGGATTTTSVDDGNGNNFSSLGNQALATNNINLSCWVLDTPAGDAGTKPTIKATCTGTGVGGGLAIAVQEVSGLAVGQTTAILDTGALHFTTNASTGTTQAVAPVTTTALNEYLVQFYADAGSGFTVTLAGYSGLDGSNTNGNAIDVVGWKNSTSGTETGTWGVSNLSAVIVGSAAFKLPGAGVAVPTVVAPPSRKRRSYRGFSLFRKGPINPVAIPKILVSKPVQSRIWHRKGVSLFSKGPVNPVPIPKIIVSPPPRSLRKEFGRIRFVIGVTPAAAVPAPVAPVFVNRPVRARRGQLHLFQGPVNPVPIPPQVVSAPTHVKRRGRVLFVLPTVPPRALVLVKRPVRARRGQVHLFQGPVNPVPIPPQVISTPAKVKRRGQIHLFQGPTPLSVPTVAPAPIVSKPVRGRRGRLQLFQGPVNPVPIPPKVVSKPPRARRGQVRLFQGPVPSVTPAPVAPVFVSKPPGARRGQVKLLRGTVPPTPVPLTLVTKPPAPRRGRIRFWRGPVNAVAIPPQVVSKPPPHRRGRIRLFKGVTFVPPFSVGFPHGGSSPQDAPGGSVTVTTTVAGTVAPDVTTSGTAAGQSSLSGTSDPQSTEEAV